MPENYSLQGAKIGNMTAIQSSTSQLPKKLEPAIYDFELDQILSKIDKEGALTSVTRALLVLKLNQLCKEADLP